MYILLTKGGLCKLPKMLSNFNRYLSSSSPESLGIDRNDSKSPLPMVSPTVFYKLLVPLLRCEVPDMRDSVVQALGRINHVAMMDLMGEVGLFSK